MRIAAFPVIPDCFVDLNNRASELSDILFERRKVGEADLRSPCQSLGLAFKEQGSLLAL